MRTDELWGNVLESWGNGDFLLEVTEIDADDENAYDQHERIGSADVPVQVDDFVHVWIDWRDRSGALHGRVVVEDDDDDDD